MRVLVFNAGSSSLKVQVFDGDRSALTPVVRASVTGIGEAAVLKYGDDAEGERLRLPGHADAASAVVDRIEQDGNRVELVAHRIVHGGPYFNAPVAIDDRVLHRLEELTSLAPLHNEAALNVIRTACRRFGGVPMAAVFDTEFHASLPPVVVEYAIPRDVALQNGIRRYGFHGIAHEAMLLRWAELASLDANRTRAISLQLGSGSSACAIADGRSVDTSMGFTPLEGLIMGTRCGDLDSGVVLHLIARRGYRAEDLRDLLNTESGLLGLSSLSSNMSELEQAAASDPGARLAIDAYCYRLRKCIGAYLAVLDGADAILFGGGIGENSALVRSKACEGLRHCGVEIDEGRNQNLGRREDFISTAGSRVAVWVIHVEEEPLIARKAMQLFGGRTP